MSAGHSSPPAIYAWLMRRSLVPQDRDAVMGDLHEEFNTIAGASGTDAARRWYRRQVRTSIAHNVRHRLAWMRMVGIVQDFRHAVRSLRATPTFTVVALAVLTLGIGATTAIFSVVDGIVLRGLPYWHGDRLVKITEPSTSRHGAQGSSVPAADIADWRTAQTTFEDLAAVQLGDQQSFMMRDAGAMRELRALMVSASLFPMLRARPALGRAFTTDDEVGQERIAILSDAFWRRQFGADPSVVGRTLDLESGSWQIAGVMPPGFTYPPASTRPADLWIPYVPIAAELSRGDGTRRSAHAEVVGRLKAGVSIEQARADIERIAGAIRQQNPVWMRDRIVVLTPLQDSIVGAVKSWMLMLLGAVAFVLLIACVNVANLLLARATARARDVAVRSALGASRWRILRGLLAESLVLSAAGTTLGVCAAIWGVHVLRAALPPSLPRLDEVAINYRVLAAAACTAVAVAIGVTPIWQWSPSTLTASLREAGRSASAGVARQRVRLVLLVVEMALAVVLLIGSGLFMSSFVKLVRVDLGFELTNILSVDLSPRGRFRSRDALPPAVAQTVEAAFEQVRRVPGVEHAAIVAGTPPLVSGLDRTSVVIPGKPAFGGADEDSADDKSVTADYFRVFGVPLVGGRFFTEADATPGAPRVIILNDIAASRYFQGANPLGADIRLGLTSDVTYTVIGVVRSVRLQGPEGDLRPEIYRPLDWRQPIGSPVITLVMRTSRDPGALASPVRAAIQSVSPDLTFPNAETYDTLFDRLIAQRKFNTWILALFGVLAIAIAGVGIYGVMAYIVEQRTQEIGVRIALGADPADVIRMVLSQAGTCVAAGLTVGLAAGWMLSRSVQAFLFRIDAHDPFVYAGAAAVLILAGLAAAVIPARRAARVDPMIALRAQ
jgi:putative ABC transport system permease protein